MKSHLKPALKSLALLCIFCAYVNCLALDREAFNITNYDLDVQIDPAQHRLGVRGRITLRNDSATPQKNAVLQISSSLDWRSIKAGDKAVQFVRQPFTSDIDHTGALSEAIVTLPQPVAPKGTVELDIGYEGVILLDATRLTRIGTPEDVAKSTDWDQIGADFTAVRGAGYVAWYPIATEAADLSEDNSLFDVLGRWKAREADAGMSVLFESTMDAPILFSGNRNLAEVSREEGILKIGDFSMLHMRTNVPTFVIGDYKQMDVNGMSSIAYLPGKPSAAQSYAQLLGTLDPLPAAIGPKWIQVVQLADQDATPFASEDMLLTPLRPIITDEDRLTLVYALARHEATSPQAWVSEGLAHLAQVLDIEQQHGRSAALQYLRAHESILVDFEKQANLPENSKEVAAASHSLVDTTDEIYLQSKAMWVWSMFRDMVGYAGMDIVLFSYHAADDKNPSYMAGLIAKHTKRDLQWFFDDWVYHDRGLPDFKVESAYSTKTAANNFLVTITVDNLGAAGAEVPLTVKFVGGEIAKRIEVRAKSKVTIRLETSAAPAEIVVNDGSVPESDMTNNVYKVEAAK